jgi:hypothetical protein
LYKFPQAYVGCIKLDKAGQLGKNNHFSKNDFSKRPPHPRSYDCKVENTSNNISPGIDGFS